MNLSAIVAKEIFSTMCKCIFRYHKEESFVDTLKERDPRDVKKMRQLLSREDNSVTDRERPADGKREKIIDRQQIDGSYGTNINR